MNVANPYEYFHTVHIPDAVGVRIALVVSLVVVGALAYIGLHQKSLSRSWIFLFATTTLVLMPYVMPKMHDRYFLPGQVFLIILACCRPRFVVPAVLVEIALLLPYLNYFRYQPGLDGLEIALMASTAAVFIMARELIRSRNTDGVPKRIAS